MAYKFQLGPAVMSGSLTQEGGLTILDDDGTQRLSVDRDSGKISGSGVMDIAGAATFSSTIAASGSVTAGTSFIIGSADLNETDMEKLDGITDGTAAANKALVLDAHPPCPRTRTPAAAYPRAAPLARTSRWSRRRSSAACPS